MGFWSNFFGGLAAAKTYQNVYNRPVVIPPPGYVVRGMEQRGVGSTWVITYSKQDNLNYKQTFSINSSTRSMSVGGDVFTVDWPK